MSPLALSLRFLQTQSDEQLAALARAGHERAFEALVRRYRRPLLAYCRRIGSAGTNPEDTLQQALLQAWSAIRTGVEVRDPRAWLYRIVHNVAISNHRRPALVPVEIRDTVGANGADFEAEQRMAARDALAGLAALPDLQREVMVGTAVDGMSHEELASALGLSSGAVRGLIYRARATLRAAAAAITPGPLIAWAARSGSGPGSGFYEALAGGGTAGLGGILVKGGAIVATAGAIATATGISTSHKSVHHRATRTAAVARRQVITRPATASVASSRVLVADPTSSHVSIAPVPGPQQGTPESSGHGSSENHGFASVIAKRQPTERHDGGSASSGKGDAPSGHDGSHRGSTSDGSNAGTGSTTVTGGSGSGDGGGGTSGNDGGTSGGTSGSGDSLSSGGPTIATTVSSDDGGSDGGGSGRDGGTTTTTITSGDGGSSDSGQHGGT